MIWLPTSGLRAEIFVGQVGGADSGIGGYEVENLLRDFREAFALEYELALDGGYEREPLAAALVDRESRAAQPPAQVVRRHYREFLLLAARLFYVPADSAERQFCDIFAAHSHLLVSPDELRAELFGDVGPRGLARVERLRRALLRLFELEHRLFLHRFKPRGDLVGVAHALYRRGELFKRHFREFAAVVFADGLAVFVPVRRAEQVAGYRAPVDDLEFALRRFGVDFLGDKKFVELRVDPAAVFAAASSSKGRLSGWAQ